MMGLVGLGEVGSLAIDFLGRHEPADGQRSRAAKPSRRDARTGGGALAEPRTAAPLRDGRRWATRSAAALAWWEGFSEMGVGSPRYWIGWSQRVAHHCPSKWAWACRCSGCRASLRVGGDAWWGAATARRVQSLRRRRHRSGSHAVTRTRALAVPDPGHPACSPCARQRIWPSRRP